VVSSDLGRFLSLIETIPFHDVLPIPAQFLDLVEVALMIVERVVGSL
jgi:hypothetical protein